ncbi:MAG: hypothetical protein A2848_02255 [Candidatus Magasanikbacteria bacterium RIFCSPHIGHO2_01_FULL_50_8]|uniref:Glycosyltransferase 2-like domain-containing protein n=1 Tax=Candidatus Magasanikbacteria bacterium RIFCSPHIGHO2_01_FULL_50_8 TaxID=1798674 RepID=A0A1F6LP19_9BACT|nr:MAG: hypothetical protein A2848_02255 [Candidatus Magasanikbacteria bacterium RIFCSPHIGHO2_01_FULL_50_8]
MERLHKIPCTIEVLTHNSAATLERTLQSLESFDQIIVIDGQSTDATREIAARFHAEIIDQQAQHQKKLNTIGDFAAIRNQGVAQARHKWFAFVDSDELLTSAVVQEIADLVGAQTPPGAYWIPRKYTLDGEVIERACTYPNKQMRFFHLDSTNGFIKKVHERIAVKAGMPIGSLRNAMLVPVTTDPIARRRKQRYYVQIEAELHSEMSVREYLRFAARHLGVSVLYAFRSIRNIFWGSGKRLPWRYELDYHFYNALLMKQFLKKIRWL